MDILTLLIIVLIVLSGGGYYLARPGYSRAGAGIGNVLYLLAVIVLALIVLHVLGVF
jgi:hypothetical protein